MDLDQNRTIIGYVSKQSEVRRWIFLGNGEDKTRPGGGDQGGVKDGITAWQSGLGPPPPQLLKIPIIRKNGFSIYRSRRSNEM